MKYIVSDKYERKLWIIAVVSIFTAFVVEISIQAFFPLSPVIKKPLWWNDLENYSKIFCFLLAISFYFAIIKRGRKIMKSKEYQDMLIENKQDTPKKIDPRRRKAEIWTLTVRFIA
ncbi:MAG: hypothetical protein LBI13_03410 [Streptococcaceae bacterium]|jgi:hypothetical protein|nr:hypothetical protein [Streptococcaceae bacterium]